MIFLLTLLLALPIISTDIYLPSLNEMSIIFNAGAEETQLTLTVYFFIFCLVQLIYGPLSDHFGRKPVLLSSLLIYILGTVLCIYSPTIQVFTLGRAIQAFGAGSAILIFAIIRDLYEGERVTKMIAYMSAVVALSPIVAPIVGGYIQASWSWQGNFMTLGFFGILAFAMSVCLLPETNKFLVKKNFKQLFHNYRSLLMNVNFMANALCAAGAFGALFAYVSASHYLFMNLMGYSPQLFGWTFAVAAMGYVLGALMSGRLISTFGMEKIFGIGMLSLLGGGVSMVLMCYIFPLNVFAILMPQLVCEFGISMIIPIAVTKALQPIPQCAGSGSALIGFLRFLFASFSSYFAFAFQNGNALPLALIILGFSLGSLVASKFSIRKILLHE